MAKGSEDTLGARKKRRSDLVKRPTSCVVLEAQRLLAILELVCVTECALCLSGLSLLAVMRCLGSEGVGAVDVVLGSEMNCSALAEIIARDDTEHAITEETGDGEGRLEGQASVDVSAIWGFQPLTVGLEDMLKVRKGLQLCF